MDGFIAAGKELIIKLFEMENFLLYLGIIIGVLVLLFIIILISGRKKKPVIEMETATNNAAINNGPIDTNNEVLNDQPISLGTTDDKSVATPVELDSEPVKEAEPDEPLITEEPIVNPEVVTLEEADEAVAPFNYEPILPEEPVSSSSDSEDKPLPVVDASPIEEPIFNEPEITPLPVEEKTTDAVKNNQFSSVFVADDKPAEPVLFAQEEPTIKESEPVTEPVVDEDDLPKLKDDQTDEEPAINPFGE